MDASSDWRARCRAEPRAWLVTGAAGFIGSHLVEELLGLGQTVRGLDDLSTGSRTNLESVRARVGAADWERFEWIQGDVRSAADCERACAGAPLVLHQAALGSVPRSLADPASTFAVNVDGFRQLFEAARRAGSPRVVYASSSSVYGDHPEPTRREDVLGAPLSPYAASKRMGEVWAAAARSAWGQDSIGLRYFNVFGPRQSASGAYAAVIPRWIAALSDGARVEVFGDGTASRDFCPVANVVQACVVAALAPKFPLEIEPVFNVGLGRRTTLAELFVALRDGLAARGAPCAGHALLASPERPGDVRHSLADLERATRVLGYRPEVDFEAGIAHVLDAARSVVGAEPTTASDRA